MLKYRILLIIEKKILFDINEMQQSGKYDASFSVNGNTIFDKSPEDLAKIFGSNYKIYNSILELQR